MLTQLKIIYKLGYIHEGINLDNILCTDNTYTKLTIIDFTNMSKVTHHTWKNVKLRTLRKLFSNNNLTNIV